MIAVLAIVLGLFIGWFMPIGLSSAWSLYVAVAILAAIDSVFGAIRSSMENRFDSIIFISGFITNAILAGFLAYIGDYLGIPLYYAAVFAFGVRLFQNLAIVRRLLIDNYREKWRKNHRSKEDFSSEELGE
jgi:small basic protein